MVARDLPADGVARRFLLGELDEPERSALEQRLIAEGKVQDRLALVESELVDDYLNNRLPPRDRTRFERRYLTHAEGVRKVDFARLLRRRMTGGEEVQPAAVPAGRPGIQPRWLTMAASLLVAGLTGILSWQTWQTRETLEIKEAEIAAARDRERALAERLRAAEGQLERVQKEQETSRTPASSPPPPPEPSEPSFLLHPGTLRDAGSAAQSVAVSGATRSVRLELAWPADPAFTYRAVIQTPDQAEVWSAEGLASGGKAGSAVLLLSVPAGALQPGDYILRLYARELQADWESVADFSFRVRL